jgi:hypothetical protein
VQRQSNSRTLKDINWYDGILTCMARIRLPHDFHEPKSMTLREYMCEMWKDDN